MEDEQPVQVVYYDLWCERLKPIEKEISSNGVTKSKPCYDFHDFVHLLASIGYRVILVAHQFDGSRRSIHR